MLPVLLSAPPAHADRSPEPSLAESLQGPAKTAYDSAHLLFNNGDFAGASTKYKQAYELSRDPRLLYDMALCAKSLRKYAQMRTLLQRFESEYAPKMSPDTRSAVDDALAAIRNLVGAVRVTANVDGAAVTVDGEASGATPLASPLLLDLGPHAVALARAGFEPSTQTVEVSGGGEQALAFTLKESATGGHLLVVTDDDATVVVDGSAAGKGRFDGALAAGAHDVRVTEDGMLPYAAQIDLHAGETRTLQVSLTKASRGAPIWPWVVGGVVVAAGAAVGGYFLFRPQDQTTPVPSGGAQSQGFVQFMSRGIR